MKKFLSIAAMLLAFAAIANAQGKLGFTVEAGLNLSNFAGDTSFSGTEECNVKPGFNIGVMVDVPFSDAIYLKSGLKYSQRGYKTEEDGYEEEVKLGYLQIPIMASYHFAISDNIELQACIGPYFAIALHGKEYYYEEDGKDVYEYEPKIKFGKEENLETDNSYKRFDFGLVLPSVGVKIQNFYVGISNEIGLVNVCTPMYDEEEANYDAVRNYNFSINVGYTF